MTGICKLAYRNLIETGMVHTLHISEVLMNELWNFDRVLLSVCVAQPNVELARQRIVQLRIKRSYKRRLSCSASMMYLS